MAFYFIRHGETDWNLARRLQGLTDIPLNQKGRLQAKACGDRLCSGGVTFDRVYVSPLIRARETAALVTGLSEDRMTVVPEMHEMAFGSLEGAVYRVDDPAAAARMDENVRNFKARPSLFVPGEGGESFQALADRAEGCLRRLRDMEAGLEGNALAVSHGSFLHAVLYVLSGRADLDRFWDTEIPNCTVIRTDPETWTALG